MFDEKKAQKAVEFISSLKHTKGRWAGVKWNWIPWQEELIRKIFGTVDDNGYRQYRTVYVEIPKKNGKSETGAAIALKLLCADNEPGAEIYGAAGDRDQASIVFNVANQMVRLNPTLKNYIKPIPSTKRMIVHKTSSVYRALSSESFTKHGYNPSGIIFDELHVQKNRVLYDTLVEGTDTARSQQLVFIITTAGIHDQTTIGWEVHDYAVKVKKGVIEDPTFLPVIYAADEKDDWEDPKVWAKCNPSLDYIFDIDKIEKHYSAVKNNPARQNNFRRFRLNQWVGQVSRYIPMTHWDACNGKVDIEKLSKRPCYAGLDLSSTQDLTALVCVFPPEGNEPWQVLPYFFVPEDTIREKSKSDRAPYDLWARDGLITPTPGNAIDYQFIRKKVNEIDELFDLKEVAYDPWGSTQIAIQLGEEDGIPMVQHRQGYKSMSPPTKELLKRILAHEIAHGGHKVLRWCADNLAVQIDAAENVKPVKDKSSGRIDGVVALIMAMGVALVNADPGSMYDKVCSECRGKGEIEGEVCWRCAGLGTPTILVL